MMMKVVRRRRPMVMLEMVLLLRLLLLLVMISQRFGLLYDHPVDVVRRSRGRRRLFGLSYGYGSDTATRLLEFRVVPDGQVRRLRSRGDTGRQFGLWPLQRLKPAAKKKRKKPTEVEKKRSATRFLHCSVYINLLRRRRRCLYGFETRVISVDAVERRRCRPVVVVVVVVRRCRRRFGYRRLL